MAVKLGLTEWLEAESGDLVSKKTLHLQVAWVKILVEHMASHREKPIKIPSLHVCPGFLPVFPAEKLGREKIPACSDKSSFLCTTSSRSSE